jgi:uncharacterized YkwD family protein
MKRKICALALVLPLIFTISCSQKKQKPIAGIESSVSEAGIIKNVKITAPSATLRTGCSNTASVAQSVNKDTTLNVINEVSDWYAVQLSGNQIGFVSKDQSKPVVVDDNKTNIPPSNTATTSQGISTPKTPSSKTNSSTLSAAEQQMVTLVNQARAQNRVPALKVDMTVTNVARIKAQDMIDNNYFSHNSPKYGSPFDMMKAFGIKYIMSGENIAGNPNIANAESSLMNSPGHRKNILNPEYTHIGIGIKAGGPYGNMISQMFVSKPQ